MSAPRAVRALALACLFASLVATGAPAAEGDAPLNIAADNMTGGRGPEGDEVYLNGNLRVTRGRAVLTADQGRYLRAQGRLFLDGHVRMQDSTTVVTCERATYSEIDDVLDLEGNVTMVDRDATLRAPRGRYDRRAGRADLEGGVEGRDRYQRLVADRASYLRDSLRVLASGHCRGFDDDRKLSLESDRLDYDRRTHVAVATGNPLLRTTDDRDKETIIRALRLTLDTETRIAEATDSVKVERDTLRGRADYARFDDRAQYGVLTGSPRFWDDQTTMSGDTLEIYTQNRALQRLVVLNGAVMDYRGNRPQTEGETSRLTGRRADIWFTRDEIDSLVAIGGAQNQYVAPMQAGKTPERNAAFGDTITVFFKDRKIDHARVEGGAHGEYRLAVDVGDTTAAKLEVVDYEGARITFVVPKSRIVLDRRAGLKYRDLQLSAKRVEYDLDKQSLVADGDPELIDRGDKVDGHLMTYDMNTRVGTIYHAETAYERGLYHGEQIRKVSEKELDVYKGAYSTCSLDAPHYHFSSKWMKIYLKDKLVAKPVVFYLRNIPVLALPFWVFPIKPGRHSGLLLPQVEFGFSDAAGQFVRNAGYYWAPNDYMDLTLSGDYYRAEPSWVIRADGLYRLLYALDGSFNGSFARNDRLLRDDYDLTFNHVQVVTPRTRVVARGQFVSSRDYNSSNQYGRTLAQRLNSILRSGFSISHDADWASFTALVDRTQFLNAEDDIADPDGQGPEHGGKLGQLAPQLNTSDVLPSVSVSFPTRTLGSLGIVRGSRWEKPFSSLYLSLSSRFVGTRTDQSYVSGFQRFDGVLGPDSSVVLSKRVTQRRGFASNFSASDQRKAFGWINLAPTFNSQFVVFDFDELGHEVVPAAVWSGGLRASSNFYGTLNRRFGPVTALRHVVTPSVSYSYSPNFDHLQYRDPSGALRPRFNGFGDIGISGFEQSFLSFNLLQRLQAKLRDGEQIRRLDNLVQLNTSGTYNLLWRERGLKHGLSPLSWSLFFQTPRFVSANFGWSTDLYEAKPLRSLGYNLNLSLASRGGGPNGVSPDLPLVDPTRQEQEQREEFRQAWSVDAAYSYQGSAAALGWTNSQTLNTIGRLQLSPGWGLEYAANFNLSLRQVQTQRWGVSRDIHCWVASFSRTFVQGGEAEYYFRLGVKDQREIYYERGTRGGSFGGIQ